MQRVTVTVLACGAHGTEVAAARQVFNIGFTTHHGSVACAEEWGAPVRRRYVRPSVPGSYEVRTLPSYACLRARASHMAQTADWCFHTRAAFTSTQVSTRCRVTMTSRWLKVRTI